MGENGYEAQDSVVSGRYVENIDETNKIIRILDFDPQNPTTGQAIADTIKVKLGGFFNGTDY